MFLITLTNILYAALVEDKGGREAIYNFKGQIRNVQEEYVLCYCKLRMYKEFSYSAGRLKKQSAPKNAVGETANFRSIFN